MHTIDRDLVTDLIRELLHTGVALFGALTGKDTSGAHNGIERTLSAARAVFGAQYTRPGRVSPAYRGEPTPQAETTVEPAGDAEGTPRGQSILDRMRAKPR